MLKIGEVALEYHLSNRTLRYWEESGILKSIRKENSYRYYDDENIRRIRQIILLRKLSLSIEDIKRIFISKKLADTIEVLSRHLQNKKQETDELEAQEVLLKRLIVKLSSQSSTLLDEKIDFYSALPEFNAIQIKAHSERSISMHEKAKAKNLDDLRYLRLPKMIFACYQVTSETPEDDCWKVVGKLIRDYKLDEKIGFRHFGFNNPNPSKTSSLYGYEMWIVVPEDFDVPKPFYRREFEGGLFVSISTYLPIIGERWKTLWDWAQNNQKYEIDWNPSSGRRCLEECIDIKRFFSNEISEEERQLDLMIPVKLK